MARLPVWRSAPHWSFAVSVLIIRAGVLVAQYDRLAADPDGYRALAENIVEHGVLGRGGQPTAYRPPLYPLTLAACIAGPWPVAVAIAVAHLVLGAATVWLTLWLGRRWVLGGWAYFAAALVACDPILLNQSTLVMTETLATFLAIASLTLVSAVQTQGAGSAEDLAPSERMPFRGTTSDIVVASAAGASFALAALCRPTFLLSLAFAAVALAWTLPGWRQRVMAVAAMCIAASCVLLPWVVRNIVQLRAPIVTTTHGGYTLLLANNPEYYEFLKTAPWRAVWHADKLDTMLSASRSADEVANDRNEYALAWQTIRERPGLFLYASLLRVGSLWSLLPHQTADNESWVARLSRYAIAGWYIAVFGLALIGILCGEAQPTRSPWIFAIALAASFTAAHFFYWTDMRMRAPLVPAISLFAAKGLKFSLLRRLHAATPKT